MRIVAWLIMLVPGFIAGVGIKWMRDAFFNHLDRIFPYLWLQFLTGLIAFGLGLWFIGGFIRYRERKKRSVPK